MATLTWTGKFTQPLDRARQALASSVTFRSIVGAEDANEALAFIFIDEAPPTQDAPFATIWLEDYEAEKAAGGVRYSMNPSGVIAMMVHLEPDATQSTHSDQVIAFLNSVEAIVDNLMLTNGYDDKFAFELFRFGYDRVSVDEAVTARDEDEFRAMMMFHWQRGG